MNIRIFAYYRDIPMNLRKITVKKGKLWVEYIFFCIYLHKIYYIINYLIFLKYEQVYI